MIITMISGIIRSQTLIGLAAVAFYWSGFILYSLPQRTGPLRSSIFIFCATFLAYNLPVITRYLRSPAGHEFFIGMYILLITLVFYISIGFGMAKFIYLLHLGIIAFVYNYPFKSDQWAFLPVRTIPFLKIILIAYVWASIGSILPLFQSDYEPSIVYKMVIFFIQFLFIAAITLPFDIRDYSHDMNNRIKTFPGYFGIRNTRMAGLFLSVCYILISVLTLHSTIPFIMIGVIMMILIYLSEEDKGEFYYTGIIDGFIIVYWIILYFCSYWGLL